MGASIVLERAENMLADTDARQATSRYAWASAEEIIKTISALGGSVYHGILLQTIAGANGVDQALVKKQIDREELSWLRPDAKTWAIPQRDYDL